MRSVAARFSAAARTYERQALIQQEVASRLVEMIGDLPLSEPAGRILEIGCGTGVLTRLLVTRFPEARLYATDVSTAMVSQARAVCGAKDRIRWFVADAGGLGLRASFPLIVSSSSLHWITPLDPALDALRGLLEYQGYLACAVMVHGTLAELHEARRRVAPNKLPPGRLPTDDEVTEAIARMGFCVSKTRTETLRARYFSGRDFLRCVHEQGLTGGAVSAAAAPLTRGELQRLAAEYDAGFRGPEGGVFASYRVLYVAAWRIR